MKKEALKEWIEAIPVGKYETVRRRIISECKTSRASFSQWKNGLVLPSPLARDIIDRIAREETGRSVYSTPQPPEGGAFTPNP